MSGGDGALAKVKWLWKEEKSAGLVYSTAASFKGRGEWVSNLYSAADAKCGLARMLMSPRSSACVCTAKACLLLKSRVLFIEFFNFFFFLLEHVTSTTAAGLGSWVVGIFSPNLWRSRRKRLSHLFTICQPVFIYFVDKSGRNGFTLIFTVSCKYFLKLFLNVLLWLTWPTI